MNLKTYPIEGEDLTFPMIEARVDGVTADALRARLARGMFTWAELSQPQRSPRERRKKLAREPHRGTVATAPPCPITNELRRWTKNAGKGRALQLLDVHTDPLRWAL